ncbi:GntR family transcriptional regulator [Alcaligenes faecalis]|uniref:GntR family transcriptional regulator n=1 Tax=Alcaligenes faecalis TaxID=511 RepID=UPI003669CA05
MAAKPLKNNSAAYLPDAPSPRHLDLARLLTEQIQSGQPAVGELLPTETELCEQWGLSRYAVRQAVQKLCNLGLVHRQAGVGTRVIANHPQARYRQNMDSLSDLYRYAKGTHLVISNRRTIQPQQGLKELAHFDTTSPWLQLAGVRYKDLDRAEAIALVDIYVNADYSALPDLGDVLTIPVHALIERHFGIRVTRVEQEIQGVLITAEQAQTLHVDTGSAGLRIIRRYYMGDELLEVTSGVHPAERFSYAVTYTLDTQSELNG